MLEGTSHLAFLKSLQCFYFEETFFLKIQIPCPYFLNHYLILIRTIASLWEWTFSCESLVEVFFFIYLYDGVASLHGNILPKLTLDFYAKRRKDNFQREKKVIRSYIFTRSIFLQPGSIRIIHPWLWYIYISIHLLKGIPEYSINLSSVQASTGAQNSFTKSATYCLCYLIF